MRYRGFGKAPKQCNMKNKNNPKKMSGLAARLQAMQEQQQEMQRKREELERKRKGL